MLTSEITITDYAQRRRVLGRRADMRLAQALRHPVPLHEILGLQFGKGAQARESQIRHWQDGSFVEQTVILDRAA